MTCYDIGLIVNQMSARKHSDALGKAAELPPDPDPPWVYHRIETAPAHPATVTRLPVSKSTDTGSLLAR